MIIKMKRALIFLSVASIFLFVSCASEMPASIANNSIPVKESSASQDAFTESSQSFEEEENPVEGAFARASQILTQEQVGSDNFAYLLAYQWYLEWMSLMRDYEAELAETIPHYDFYDFQGYVHEQVAQWINATGKGASLREGFLEYARLYRQQFFLILEEYRKVGKEKGFITDQEELYQELIGQTYDKRAYRSIYETALLLTASLPEREIYLYGAYPFGVVLEVQGQSHLYADWRHPPWNRREPQLAVNDWDHDGQEELAVASFETSGSPVNREYLHIVKLDPDNLFEAFVFGHTECYALLKDKIIPRYNSETKKIEVTYETQKCEIEVPEDISFYTDCAIVEGFSQLFSFEEDEIVTMFSLGLGKSGLPLQLDITAEVEFDGVEFQLKNIRY